MSSSFGASTPAAFSAGSAAQAPAAGTATGAAQPLGTAPTSQGAAGLQAQQAHNVPPAGANPATYAAGSTHASGGAAPQAAAGQATGAAPSAALKPVSVPFGVLPDYTKATGESLFTLTAKRFSIGKDSVVADVHGKTAFKINAKAVSLHDRKEITAADGRHLYTLTKRIVSLRPTFDIADGAYPDKTLASITQTKKHKHEAGDELKIEFKNIVGGGKEAHLYLKGSLHDRDAEITWEGQPIARIAHNFNDRKFSLKASESYALSVAAGADASLIVAILVVLDELDDDIKE